MKLKQKSVIEETKNSAGDFISNIFTKLKKNGGAKIIINLNKLDKHVIIVISILKWQLLNPLLIYVEILQLRAKCQTVMVPYLGFI